MLHVVRTYLYCVGYAKSISVKEVFDISDPVLRSVNLYSTTMFRNEFDHFRNNMSHWLTFVKFS